MSKHIADAAESLLKGAEDAVGADKKNEALKCIKLAREAIRTMGAADPVETNTDKVKPRATAKAAPAFGRGIEPGVL